MSHSLVGREVELVKVRQFVSDVRSGGSSLVLRGEPGAGKSALLDVAAGAATDAGLRVLRSTGVEFEAEIAFSGLHEVLFPLSDSIKAVSSRYATAVRVALGLDEGPPPDQLLLSNAVLDVLVDASKEYPVLVVVDDLQWVDRSSAAILGTVARRLRGMRVGFIAALRDDQAGFFDRTGLAELNVSPLDESAARTLVDSRYPSLHPRARQQILMAASGNPLALIELPEALNAAGLSVTTGASSVLPLTYRLRSMYASRISGFSSATKDALLLAALEGTGDLGVLVRACGGSLADLRPAEEARLVQGDEATRKLVFRHPLVRSAVVDTAPFEDRRRAHRKLAGALEDEPDRFVWHLAEASSGPNEQVALLLEQLSHRNVGRGDAVGAVGVLTRAADMSPSRSDRARRLAEAAYIGAAQVGELGSAAQLLKEAQRIDPDSSRSLEAATVAAYLQINGDGSVETAHRLLVAALESHASDNCSPEALDAAFGVLYTACLLGHSATLWEPYHAHLARLRARVSDVNYLLSKCFADPVRTALEALPELELAIRRLPEATDDVEITAIAGAAFCVDRVAECRPALWRVVQSGRAGGAVTSAINALATLASDAYESGRWDECNQLAEEGDRLADRLGYKFTIVIFWYRRALVAAVRGDGVVAEALVGDVLDWGRPRGQRVVETFARHAEMLLAEGRGDFDKAYHLAAAISPAGQFKSHVPQATSVIFDLVEAATRTAREREAAAHVAAMYEADLPSLSPRLGMLTTASAALVSAGAHAYALFEQALGTPGAAEWPFDQARIHLVYGERLRRDRQLAKARQHLTSAMQILTELGAEPWRARAANELRALGGSGTRAPGSWSTDLTPQEREIAGLAAAGKTNKEIASQLFLSPRTVSAHLYKIFPKLGITTRAALRDALDGRSISDA